MLAALSLLAALVHAAPVSVRRAPVEELPALPQSAAASAVLPQPVAAPLDAALAADGVPETMAARGAGGGRGARTGRAAGSRRTRGAAASGGGSDDGDGRDAAGAATDAPALDFDHAGPKASRPELPEPVVRLRELVKEAVVSGAVRGVASISAGPSGVTVRVEPSADRRSVETGLAARLGEGTGAPLSFAVEPPRFSDLTFEQRQAAASEEPAPKGPAELVFGALPVQMLEQALVRRLSRMKLDARVSALVGPDARPYFRIKFAGSKRDYNRLIGLATDPRRGFPYFGPVPVQLRVRIEPPAKAPRKTSRSRRRR